ncbi:RsmB/NOP family class I SAM-dependent RNA methyltransferase [Pullulanibacillus sp. KACC 23026]|uniref:RsmF rRNA methyltransferase first C-terminal domain-containing protein n=1 Tax=Pullulanibacillus sp. KACC 23026 TaxID=3028315 RepID=UPI0023B0161C|nr:RsmB/NOP family class I SAM-dependent RNA methyltransferase [Pullulanibacillus sp. KACC 23026]WEG12300.1 RsmB/NOP family class I SAM-dependent RNA methyltransferase [Pullulanibacillus sp. KACC 23026]
MKLPDAFEERMNQMLGAEAEAFLNTYEEPKSQGLRFNPLKIDRDAFLKLTPFDLQPVPFCETGFYYKTQDEPGKHPYHQAGMYYIQEPSAMAVADLLDVSPGERVLDLCAAPGGKSSQLAGKMAGQGLLVSNEFIPKRAKILSENLERMGVTNALVTNESPERLASFFGEWFDRVLVDAPCSGEGMFRKDPAAADYWSPEHVHECSKLQHDILDHAYSLLKPGGTLVYSTCTFSAEENEQMMEQFLNDYADMELLSLEHTNGIEPGRPEWTRTGVTEVVKTSRLWPHKLLGEGHFAAKLRKKSDATSHIGGGNLKEEKGLLPKGQAKDFLKFVKDTLKVEPPNKYKLMGRHIYAIPDGLPDVSGLKVLRCGLHLGELKKNRFEPNHAWAVALCPEEVRRVHELSSESEDWRNYLRGETLPTSVSDGWTLVLIDGYSLGWGKAVQGTLKNYYPKGLRRP